MLAACGNNDDQKIKELESTIESLKKENATLKGETTSSSTDDAKKSTNNAKIYGLNEEAFIKDSKGNTLYSLKLLKATTALTQTNEIYTEGKPQNTVEVTYEYKNYSVDKPIIITSQFVHAFAKDGKAGKDVGMQSGQTEVNKGRSAQSTVWFVMPEEQTNENEIEIEYSDDFSLGFENKTIKFKVPLEH